MFTKWSLRKSCRPPLQPVVFASSTLGGGSVAISSLVLVFAATRKEIALQPVLFDPKTKCRNYRCMSK